MYCVFGKCKTEKNKISNTQEEHNTAKAKKPQGKNSQEFSVKKCRASSVI